LLLLQYRKAQAAAVSEAQAEVAAQSTTIHGSFY
jgi:hypothetical protein